VRAQRRRRAAGAIAALRAVCAALLVVTLSACSAPAPDTGADDDHAPYRIGLIASQSGAGALYGAQQLDSTKWAAGLINEAGGIDGHPIEIVLRDDRSDPERGPVVMRELIEDEGVVAVIGPTLSIVSQQAHPVANELQTPVLAISNAVEGIVGDCPYACEWIWRNSLGERVAVQANVSAYVFQDKPRSAVTVKTRDDILGTNGVAYATAAFEHEGVPVVGQVELDRDEYMNDKLAELLAAEPDALFIGSTYGDWAAGLMREARALGYTGQFLGGNIFNSERTRELAGEAGIGTRSGAAWVISNGFPANDKFVDAYERAIGRLPDQFDAQGATAIQILAAALTQADAGGLPLVEQRAALQAALPDVAISTVLGPFRFTADHDVDQIVWVLEMTEDGHRLVAFCDPDCGSH